MHILSRLDGWHAAGVSGDRPPRSRQNLPVAGEHSLAHCTSANNRVGYSSVRTTVCSRGVDLGVCRSTVKYIAATHIAQHNRRAAYRVLAGQNKVQCSLFPREGAHHLPRPSPPNALWTPASCCKNSSGVARSVHPYVTTFFRVAAESIRFWYSQ